MTQELIERLTKLREERGRIYEVAGDAVDVALAEAADALQSQSARIAELREALREAEQFLDKANALALGQYTGSRQIIANRLAEVRDSARDALTKDSTSVTG